MAHQLLRNLLLDKLINKLILKPLSIVFDNGFFNLMKQTVTQHFFKYIE